MKISHVLSAAALALATSTQAPAATYVLDFNPAEACAGPCSPFSLISQDYGDVPGVIDISWMSVPFPGDPASGSSEIVFYWDTFYGDLTDVIFSGRRLEVKFTLAEPGNSITFNSIDYASYFSAERDTKLSLYSLDFAPLAATTQHIVRGGGHQSWSPNIFGEQPTQTGGMILHLGPDAFNVGFDNLTFTVNAIVPEPATWLTMILGFFAVGGAMRLGLRHEDLAIAA